MSSNGLEQEVGPDDPFGAGEVLPIHIGNCFDHVKDEIQDEVETSPQSLPLNIDIKQEVELDLSVTNYLDPSKTCSGGSHQNGIVKTELVTISEYHFQESRLHHDLRCVGVSYPGTTETVETNQKSGFLHPNHKMLKIESTECSTSSSNLDDTSEHFDLKPDSNGLMQCSAIKTEPVKPEPVKLEPVKPEPLKEEQVKAEPEDLKKEEESDDDEEEDEDEETSSESDDQIDPRAKLRKRRVNKASVAALKKRNLYSKISKIVRRCSREGVSRTKEEDKLFARHSKIFKEVLKNLNKRQLEEDRKKEIEDSPAKLTKKCAQLSKAIQKAKNLVVYTGAGISTAANIPDYRGPNGVWTLLDKGQEVADCDLGNAEPTYTHMALFTLFKKGKLKHIVSQNCDGLHLRSGIPRYALSEVHGNMFIEICKRCKPMRPFIRLFDVTEKTNRNRHATGRRCHVCGHSLVDTIVHFGERGYFKWPINWDGASKAAEKADMILCLGSSLKVLRHYPWLWCMDRPKKLRPPLYIVNLQWTPKDSAATLKLNGRCDEIMKKVMSNLEFEVPDYFPANDPLLTYSTPLHPMEEHTTTRKVIIGRTKPEFRVRSWSLDHSYTKKKYEDPEKPKPKETPKSGRGGKKQGCFVPRQNVDYKTAVWPRDALYCPYKELKFEYVFDLEAEGQVGYYCVCCDPALKRKRNSSESGDEDEEEDEEDENSEEDQDDKDSKSSESLSKTDSTEKAEEEPKDRTASRSSTTAPGWFGKGRRIKKLKY